MMMKSDHILIRHENERERAGRLHLFQTPGIAQLLVLVFIASDAFTLFTVFDLMLTQAVWMSRVVTVTVAAVINIAPMLLAAELRNPDLSERMRKILCSVLLGLFLLLFLVTFGLRYASRGELFASTAQLDSFSFSDTLEEPKQQEQREPTAAQNILAVILGLEPLATSICSFVLGYEKSPKRHQQHVRNLQSIELHQLLDSYRVMAQELEEDMAYDLDGYDNAQYVHMQELVCAMAENAKNTSRRKLAMTEASPEGVNHLLEGGYKSIQPESLPRDAEVPVALPASDRAAEVTNIA